MEPWITPKELHTRYCVLGSTLNHKVVLALSFHLHNSSPHFLPPALSAPPHKHSHQKLLWRTAVNITQYLKSLGESEYEEKRSWCISGKLEALRWVDVNLRIWSQRGLYWEHACGSKKVKMMFDSIRFKVLVLFCFCYLFF